MVFGLAGLIALVKKFVDFLKCVTAQSWKKSLTQLVAWAGGLAGTFLYSSTQWAADTKIGSLSLRALNGPSKIVVGLMVGSLGSLVADVIKGVDNTDSAAVPPLGGDTPSPPTP